MKQRSILTIAIVLLLAGCGADEHAATTAAKTVEADTIKVGLSTMPVIDAEPGAVVSEQQVQVASRLMGYIREIRVHEGDAVKAGQLLFTIDPSDINGQLNQARAGVAQAEAALLDAKADYERFSNLYQEESIPKQQYDKIKLQYSIAQSQAKAAHAGLDTAESQLRYAEVRAPIDGVVTQKMASTGDLAAPGRPVLVLENPARLEVQTSVSEQTYAHLKLNDAAELEIAGLAAPLTGKITRLVPAADAMSHTHLVKLDLPAGSGVVSGTFVRVRFNVGSTEGISVPKSALLQRAGITGVFVADGQGIARYRMVRTGSVSGNHVAIEAGLSPGDTIVVAGNGEIDSGDKINPAGSKAP